MSSLTIQQGIELAWRHFQQGQFGNAEAIGKQILSVDPQSADAMQLLGLVAAQTGRTAEGIELLRRAIAIAPQNAANHYNLACVYMAGGQNAEAVDSLQRALFISPDLPEALAMLGNLNLLAGQADEAIALYQRSLKLRPDLAEAHTNFGNALRSKGRLDEAVAAYRQAISLKPKSAEAYYNLAIVLKSQHLLDESRNAFQQTIQLQPGNLDAYNNLAVVLQLLAQSSQAEAVLQKALSINPAAPQTCCNLGKLAQDAGRFDQAIQRYQQAIAAAPQWALPHYNYGLCLLTKGEFQQGWQQAEWRRKAPELEIFCQDFPKPQWDGTPLNGRTILIHSEQGFGDAIQFARYLHNVAALGGRIVFQCHPPLQRLFACLNDIAEVIPLGNPLPDFDVHCPLLTLPLLFRTDLSNIPQTVPYVKAEPQLVETWRQRLAIHDGQLKVGVVWAGRPKPPGRSIAPELLIPLLQIPHVALISAQVDAAAGALPIADYSKQMSDFSDTAALLANLDLLITVDTAAAHLAGSMGKPTWVLLPFVPDWRWLLDRSDSPWYPTMRLFRQRAAGDWSDPIEQVLAELRKQQV